jgi:hypothetical protein
MGEWRKLHSVEFHNLYSSPDVIRQIKSRGMGWLGQVACVGGERKVYKGFGGKVRRKETAWKTDGIKGRMGLGCILKRLNDVSMSVWIHLVQDMDWWQAVVNMVVNLRVLAPWS